MNLIEAEQNIGKTVVYRAPYHYTDSPGETGVITSVNDIYVFVRYGSDKYSKATSARTLTLAEETS